MKKTEWIALAFCGFLFACDSPLMDHASAQDPGRDANRSEQNSDCPLSFPHHSLCADLQWDKTPNDHDAASFTLRFWESPGASQNGPYVSPSDRVFVKLWMPSMGHGSAPIKLTQESDAEGPLPGVFSGSEVYFIMPGAWQVKVQLEQESTLTEEADLDVQI